MAIAAATGRAPRAGAQESQRPYVPLAVSADWRTITTEHFAFHFPASLEAWVRDAATTAESERDAIRRVVGYVPPGRITVLVADPYNDANGSAYPFLRGPAVFLWPVPADARSQVGTSRRWVELLTLHEVAHVAHLARPSRNPLRGTLASLLPTNVGPVASRTPRWVWEGYATYVEGVLTHSGRPFGPWRPAYLRQWALEGRLPTYAQVSGSGGYAGGSFAYLAGSAFFEWLVAQRGDSALPAVWRRLTARTPRSFDAAFAGIFPGAPAELYARWTAQVTAEAIAAEQALRTAGLAEGTLVQRLRGATGDPAVSPDGERVALVVRTPGRASRIVVLSAGPPPPDTARRRAAARLLARDPEDVAAIPYLPPARRVLASLPSRDGRAFAAPRWMPDGRHLLVERDEPLADGRVRPDLWMWDATTGAVRRVTHGGAVRDADPAPDGRSAIASRCLRGWCDIVGIDLESGAVRTLVAGSTTASYARPRWSPDGRRFAVTVQEGGRWRIRLGEFPAGGDAPTMRDVGPNDGASRYDPTFATPTSLLLTSERGGVPNIERLDLPTGRIATVTRVTGAATAPEPIAGQNALHFLSLRSTGLDLRRIALDSIAPPSTLALVGSSGADAPGGTIPVIRSRLAPRSVPNDAAAAAVAMRIADGPAADFATSPVPPSRPYGVGSPRMTLLPAGAWSADGNGVLGLLAGADPVGRLTWTLQGAAGASSTWRGGALSAAFRGLPVPLEAQAFGVAQRAIDDVRYWGGAMALAPHATLGPTTVGGRLGASAGSLRIDDATRDRTLAFATGRIATTRGRGDRLVSLALDASATHVLGDSSATRLVGRLAVAGRTPRLAARASYMRGSASRSAPAFETFHVGGAEPALTDPAVLGQRLPMPALPTGAVIGRTIEVARVGIGSRIVEPYAWAARAPGTGTGWVRALGAEGTYARGPIPFAGAPGMRITGGAAYVLDEPRRARAQVYFSVILRP